MKKRLLLINNPLFAGVGQLSSVVDIGRSAEKLQVTGDEEEELPDLPML